MSEMAAVLIDHYHTFPVRRFLHPEAEIQLDEHGFLSDASLATSHSIRDLLRQSPVLITAPPWYGKSHVAAQLDAFLRDVQDSDADVSFGKFFLLTAFETHGIAEPVRPDWWDEWKRSAEMACWIVDAIDEDVRSGHKRTHEILNILSDLTTAQRERLRVLLFCRDNERDPKIESRIQQIFEPSDSADRCLHHVNLAPLDANSARDLVGSESRFRRVCRLIAQSDLTSLAGLPRILKTLAERDVWHTVLRNVSMSSPGRLGIGPYGNYSMLRHASRQC